MAHLSEGTHQKSTRKVLTLENGARRRRRRYVYLSATLQCGVLSKDSFDRPDAFPTFIAKCSSGQKAGLPTVKFQMGYTEGTKSV